MRKKIITDVPLYPDNRPKPKKDEPTLYLAECRNGTTGKTELLLTRNAVIAMRDRCNLVLDEAHDEIEIKLAELMFANEDDN